MVDTRAEWKRTKDVGRDGIIGADRDAQDGKIAGLEAEVSSLEAKLVMAVAALTE